MQLLCTIISFEDSICGSCDSSGLDIWNISDLYDSIRDTCGYGISSVISKMDI